MIHLILYTVGGPLIHLLKWKKKKR